jgi:hypothetical protein
VTVIAPALANAIFNAFGARIRSLPITAEAVEAAMKAQSRRTSDNQYPPKGRPPEDSSRFDRCGKQLH